jgi:hypothetical protein
MGAKLGLDNESSSYPLAMGHTSEYDGSKSTTTPNQLAVCRTYKPQDHRE